MVQDFIKLQRNQVVDLCNAGIDGCVGVARQLHFAFEHLRDELLHHIFAALTLSRLASKSSLVYDLIQQTPAGGLRFRRLGGTFLRLSHWSLPCPCPAPTPS